MVGGNYHTCLEKQVNFKVLPTCQSVAIHGVFGLQYSPCHREAFCWPCINTGLLQLLSFDVTKKTQPTHQRQWKYTPYLLFTCIR